MSKRFAIWTLLATLVTVVSAEQLGPSSAPPKPDSAEAAAHVAAAEKAAGVEWKAAAEFFCSLTPRANRPDDPLLEPTRIFDNAYVIGRAGTAVFAITTSDGVVLIDAGYGDQLDSVLRPGLQALGLAEANVKYIILGHGHADHYGGASYFQQKYGTKIALAGPDWDLVENPTPPAAGAARNGGPGQGGTAAGAGQGRAAAAAPATVAPKRDVVLTDGQILTVGDQKFTIVAVPGHTPGSIGVLFPVREGRVTHTAALFGGTILIPGRIPDASLQDYVRSIEHFRGVAKRMSADVEIQNHPLYDNIAEKVAGVRAGKKGPANPFVVGQDAYQRFLTVQSECIRAQIARRAAG